MTKLTEDEQRFIDLNYKVMSVPKMKETLVGRALKTLYSYMKLKGYTPLKVVQHISNDHPFKRQNRSLELYHDARKLKRQQK